MCLAPVALWSACMKGSRESLGMRLSILHGDGTNMVVSHALYNNSCGI